MALTVKARVDVDTKRAQSSVGKLQGTFSKLGSFLASKFVVTLGDVLFETGQAELVGGALDNLSEVVDLLQSEPDKKIRIEGHTDTIGSAESNLALSDQRANAVRVALESLGINPERVTAIGLGEDFPIESNETEVGRGQNRRVDVILLDSY